MLVINLPCWWFHKWVYPKIVNWDMISHESTTDSWLRGMKLRGQCFHCLKHPLIPLCLFEMVTNIHWSYLIILSVNVFQHFPTRPLDHVRDQRGTRRLAPQGVFRHKSGPSRRYPHKKKKTHQHISTWQQILALSPWCHHPGSIRLSCRSGSDHSLEGLTEHGEFLTACSPKSYKSYMKMKMWNHVNMILSQRPDDRFYPSSSLLIPPDIFRWHLSDIDSRLADWKHTWPS